MPTTGTTRALLRRLAATVTVMALIATIQIPTADPAQAAETPAGEDEDPSSTGARPGILLDPEPYPGTSFMGGVALTRGQVAGLMAMALGLPSPTGDSFTDDQGLTHEGSINRLAQAGLSQGCAPGRYCPSQRVTRGEFAVLLERALPQPPTSLDAFADDDGTYYEGSINRLAAVGLVQGCGPASFCPHGAVTSGEASLMLSRALGSAFVSTDPVDRWRPAVAVWFRPADVERALDVIGCESRGDPTARNPRSGASGLFQHLPRYWAQRSAAAGVSGRGIFEADANIAVAAWLVYHAGGWGHWDASGACW